MSDATAAPVLMSKSEVAAQLGTNESTVGRYARRAEDPLPLRYIKGKRNGGFVIVEEFLGWVRRNTCWITERDQYGPRKEGGSDGRRCRK